MVKPSFNISASKKIRIDIYMIQKKMKDIRIKREVFYLTRKWDNGVNSDRPILNQKI